MMVRRPGLRPEDPRAEVLRLPARRRDRGDKHPPPPWRPSVGKGDSETDSLPRPVHVVEVLDQPGLLRRAPTQPLLRQLARRRAVHTDEEPERAELPGNLL